MVTRRGTNKARGSASLYTVDADGYLGGALPQSSPAIGPQDLGPGQPELAGARIREVQSTGFELGGALRPGRLWLWGSFESSDISTTSANSFPQDVSLDNLTTRLDVQLTKRNAARMWWFGSLRDELGVGVGIDRTPEASFDTDRRVDLFGLFDTHVFSPNLVATFLAGYGEGDDVWQSRGGVGPDAPEAWVDGGGVLRDGFHSGAAVGEKPYTATGR